MSSKHSWQKSETSVVRLHYYSATKAETLALIENQEFPLTGLFCADDSRPSYYLNEDQNEYIYCHDEYIDHKNGLRLISTDIRIEYIEDPQKK